MADENFDREIRLPLLSMLDRQARRQHARTQAAMAPEDTRLPFILRGIREEAEDLTEDHRDEPCGHWDVCAGHDMLRMLGAIEELLENPGADPREVITRHLTGEGESGE